MLASCAEATTAKVDGGQQERAADGAEEGSPSDLLCFCHFDHLCENSVISYWNHICYVNKYCRHFLKSCGTNQL